MREKFIEQILVRETSSRGGLCWKFTSPGTAGVPDRVVLLPGSKAGFIEVKAPGKEPTAQQLYRHEQLRDLGFQVFVLDDPEAIGGILDAIQGA
ncbi:MAG: VRR-NUC domain-containing protein [Fastidiosipilaceae bacterium]|jgi:hypothetical protein